MERERERDTNANWFSSVHCGPRAFNLMLEFVFVKKCACGEGGLVILLLTDAYRFEWKS